MSGEELPVRGGGAGETVRVKPQEDIIQFDVLGDGGLGGASSSAPAAGGKGKGARRREGSRGVGFAADAGNERPAEPKGKRHKMGDGLRKYTRPGSDGKQLKAGEDKKLATHLKKRARFDREAVERLVKSEVLQTAEAGFLEAEGREHTRKISQAEIVAAASTGVARKRFAFDVPYGSYDLSFTANGQYLLAGGRKGHVALLHCETMKISAELQLKETIRSVQTLHNQTMFAVAQRKYTYIYDHSGLELHCLKDQKFPSHLDFLPYHFLLVSATEMGDLFYRDISTGQDVVRHRTHLGPARSMRQNTRNGVMLLGHSNGTVTLWSPTVKTPLVKICCHPGHVTGVAVHGNGNYMVTAGADGLWKVWDLRKYDSVHAFRSFGHAASSVDVSMTGLVGIGFGSHVEIWKDAFSGQRPQKPYMTELYPAKEVSSVRFRPYEDVCGVGHSGGFGSILVPGAGFANFDSFEANPFETKSQRREKEVRSLLDKLQPDSIMLDPNQIGNINKVVVDKYMKETQQRKEEEEAATKTKKKKKMRGKDKVGNRLKRKHLKEGAGQRGKAQSRLGEEGNEDSEEEDDDEEDEGGGEEGGAQGAGANGRRAPGAGATGTALSRFYDKRRKKT